MIYIIFILAVIIISITNKESMFSDTTIGKFLALTAWITAFVCIIIIIVKLFKFLF